MNKIENQGMKGGLEAKKEEIGRWKGGRGEGRNIEKCGSAL
jgi:hypothetical protein